MRVGIITVGILSAGAQGSVALAELAHSVPPSPSHMANVATGAVPVSSAFIAGSGVLAPGLQDSGSLVISSDATFTAFELSAPLFPCSYELHQTFTGYHDDPARIRRVLTEKTLDFNFLLENCPPYYPTMQRPNSVHPFTETERITNFVRADECRVDPFDSIWSWIPAVIDHTEVCALVLGGDWHIPTELEITHMTQTQRSQLVHPPLPEGASLGPMHNLRVYALRMTGELAIADLATGLVTSLPIAQSTGTPAGHGDSEVALRCLRYPGSPDLPPLRQAKCLTTPPPTGTKGNRGQDSAPGATDSLQSAALREFETKLAHVAGHFERFASNVTQKKLDAAVIQRSCVSFVSWPIHLRITVWQRIPGPVVFPTWQEPLNSPSIARIRRAATKLRTFVEREYGRAKAVVDYCHAHPWVSRCDSDLIKPQRDAVILLPQALSSLATMLGTR